MAELLQVLENWEGYHPIQTAQLSEAAMDRVLNLLMNTDRFRLKMWEAKLEEAITTTDFPYLFGGILDRQLMARYTMKYPDWKSYIKVGQAKDFREKEIHKVQGQDKLLDLVAEKGEYQVTPSSDAHYHNRVYKRGKQFDISWESLINDDLGAFSDIPARFANACSFTEAYVATNQIAVAAGPNPLLFGAPITDIDGQAITNLGALPLTIANLEATVTLMVLQTDVLGEPMGIQGVHLVVPPRQELNARTIVTSALKQWTEVGAGAGVPMPVANILPQLGMQVDVNKMLPVLDTSGNRNGTWYLFADLSEGAAAQVDYLMGHETPEVCMKASNKVSVAGGAPVSPFDGDFESDNVFYRVRMCIGGAPLDPRFAYAQVTA